MDDLELISASLEAVTERCDDLVPPVFDAFFALHPEARALFGKNTGSARLSMGRMLTEMIENVTEQAGGAAYLEYTLITSANDHKASGVHLPLYDDIFRCLTDTLKQLAGEAWTPETAAAWQRQIDVILDHTRTAYHQRRPVTS